MSAAVPGHGGLPPALSGQLVWIEGKAGRIALYVDGPAAGAGPAAPLLLVHSMNATASAAEVRPVYEHARTRRPVYAIDLPGFGQAERSDRPYTIRLMTDALHQACEWIANRHGGVAVDALAVSLGCEFLARAAVEQPARWGRLALVSPTALDGRRGERRGPREAAVGPPWLLRALVGRRWSRGLFRNLTRPKVVRYFLRGTWGSKQIDEAMWHYGVLSAQQPGAEYAPLHFVSAQLFAADALTLYEQLAQPVWVSHGVRGEFADFRRAARLAERPHWRVEALPTGALPYFEMPSEFNARFDAFLA